MKKLLMLVLVLGMASLASAGLAISVDGQDPGDMITLEPSDHITLDITAFDGEKGKPVWLSIDGPGIMDATGADNLIQEDLGMPDFGIFIIDLGPAVGHGQTILIDVLIPGSTINTLPNGKIVDLIDFHCLGPIDVLVTVQNGDTGAVMDSLIIRQIPEPASMLLLGLGGLFLRRK